MTGKEHLQVKELRDVDIPKCFQQYSCRENVVGMTLPTDCQVHRIKVDTAFLKAGISLNKIDCFRDVATRGKQHTSGWAQIIM